MGRGDTNLEALQHEQGINLFRRGMPFEDYGAMAKYSLFGAADPKAPVLDVPLYARATGLGYGAAYLEQLPPAMMIAAIAGWIWDPSDYRVGGLAEWNEAQWEGLVSDLYLAEAFASVESDPWGHW